MVLGSIKGQALGRKVCGLRVNMGKVLTGTGTTHAQRLAQCADYTIATCSNVVTDTE